MLVVDVRRESTSVLRPNVVNPVFALSVSVMEAKKEDLKRRLGAVEHVMFACVHRPVLRSHLWSFSMARKPCFA